MLTAIYERVPTKELAKELISCPLTPKSHNLISPLEFTRMFDGLTSVKYLATEMRVSHHLCE